MLPEWFARSAQQSIRLPGRSPFDPMRDFGKRHLRQDQQVHMIGHDHPSLRFVKPLLALAVANRFRYLPRDSRIAQPKRPTALGESAILCGESMSGSRMDDVRRRDRQRSMQAPRYKQILTVRMKVRQPSSILSHCL